MSSSQQDIFHHNLIAALLAPLERIARATRGELSVGDLESEAWIAAQEIQQEEGRTFEPEDEGFQQAILSKLRKAFGWFANRKLRFAVRLDQDQDSDDGEGRSNSIAATLRAPEAYEPLAVLERGEENREREHRLTERFAEAIAYARALDHFDGDHMSLAAYLAITARVLQLRLASAKITLDRQPSLFDGVEVIPLDFIPMRGRPCGHTQRWCKSWYEICALARHMQRRLFHPFPVIFRSCQGRSMYCN